MNEKQRVLLDFRIERDALIAQAEKLRDSDNMNLDVSGDIHGKDQKAQKRLKEKAGRAAQVRTYLELVRPTNERFVS